MRRCIIPLALGVVLATSTVPAHAGPRSKTTAQALSGVGTGASAALFLSAFFVSDHDGDVHMPLLYAGLGSAVITPSLGQFYAGEYVTVGMAIRTAAAAIATYAVFQHTQPVRCPGVEFDVSCTNLEREAIALLGLSAIALVGGAAYDIKELPTSVERYNRRHGFTIAPMMIPSAGPPGAGPPGAGLMVTGVW